MVDRTPKYSEEETPKWSYWKQFRKVTLEEAILLSLGINPDLIPHQLEMVASSYAFEIEERTEIAYSWASSEDWSSFAIERVPSIDMVDLVGFAKWCYEDRKWKPLPFEFREIGGYVEKKDEIVETPPPKAKNPREEANDLRLIGALLALIKSSDIYKTDTELIKDLMSWYQFSPFAQRTLQDRFSKAKKALDEAK